MADDDQETGAHAVLVIAANERAFGNGRRTLGSPGAESIIPVVSVHMTEPETGARARQTEEHEDRERNQAAETNVLQC